MKLILGTWQFSGDSYGDFNQLNVNSLLDNYENLGGKFVETASSYGMNRESENRISHYLQSSQAKFKVITKIGNLPHRGLNMPQRWDEEFLHSEFDNAVSLFSNNIEAVLLHSPPANSEYSIKALKTISTLAKNNLCEFGVALNTTSDLENLEFIEAIANSGAKYITLNFSLLDQRLIKYIDIINKLYDNNVKIIVRTVLNFGFLADPYLVINKENDHRQSWHADQINMWREGALKFERLAVDNNMAILELALRFVISFNAISYLCVGFISPLELREAVSLVNKGPLVGELVDKCVEIYNSNTFFLKKQAV